MLWYPRSPFMIPTVCSPGPLTMIHMLWYPRFPVTIPTFWCPESLLLLPTLQWWLGVITNPGNTPELLTAPIIFSKRTLPPCLHPRSVSPNGQVSFMSPAKGPLTFVLLQAADLLGIGTTPAFSPASFRCKRFDSSWLISWVPICFSSIRSLEGQTKPCWESCREMVVWTPSPLGQPAPLWSSLLNHLLRELKHLWPVGRFRHHTAIGAHKRRTLRTRRLDVQPSHWWSSIQLQPYRKAPNLNLPVVGAITYLWEWEVWLHITAFLWTRRLCLLGSTAMLAPQHIRLHHKWLSFTHSFNTWTSLRYTSTSFSEVYQRIIQRMRSHGVLRIKSDSLIETLSAKETFPPLEPSVFVQVSTLGFPWTCPAAIFPSARLTLWLSLNLWICEQTGNVSGDFVFDLLALPCGWSTIIQVSPQLIRNTKINIQCHATPGAMHTREYERWGRDYPRWTIYGSWDETLWRCYKWCVMRCQLNLAKYMIKRLYRSISTIIYMLMTIATPFIGKYLSYSNVCMTEKICIWIYQEFSDTKYWISCAGCRIGPSHYLNWWWLTVNGHSLTNVRMENCQEMAFKDIVCNMSVNVLNPQTYL